MDYRTEYEKQWEWLEIEWGACQARNTANSWARIMDMLTGYKMSIVNMPDVEQKIIDLHVMWNVALRRWLDITEVK